MVRKTWVNIAVSPRLQLTSHTQPTSTLSRIKCERYIFRKSVFVRLLKFVIMFDYIPHIFVLRLYNSDSKHAWLQDNGESSVAFPVTNRVKQGCVLASTLFTIMFSAMLFDAFSGSNNGIDFRYCSDGSVSAAEGF